jgi:hypothetical protein
MRAREQSARRAAADFLFTVLIEHGIFGTLRLFSRPLRVFHRTV